MKRFSTLLLLALIFFTASNAYASETNGTITNGGNSGYAWSNQAGWVNFGCSNCGISITDSGIMGHAWNNNYGWIKMNPSNGGVTITANGALSGYAWGSSLGWINFSGVSINSSGKFVGTASGTTVGTLAFDCTNCSVVTDYRPADFRTTTTPTSTPSGGGGGGGGGGGFVFQLTPSPVPTQTPPNEPPIGTEIPGEGAPSIEIVSPVVSEAEPEENPPLFDIEVSPGPSESKRTGTFVVLAALIIATAGAAFYILRRMIKNQR